MRFLQAMASAAVTKTIRRCIAALAIGSLGVTWFLFGGEVEKAEKFPTGGGGSSLLPAIDVKTIMQGGRFQNGVSATTVSVCTRLKNEAYYLEEWLEFHLLAGVGHFHIFDDGSTDQTRAILQPYVSRGLATVVPVTDHSHDADHGQFGHRDQCLVENKGNATWIAMIDADEFMFPSKGTDLARHLGSKCPQTLSFLMVRWHMFGSNGLFKRPVKGLVTEHYRMHSRLDEASCPANQMGCFETSPPLSTKLVVNTRCVSKVGTHYVTELRPDAEANGCVTLYTPLDSKETKLVDALPLSPDEAAPSLSKAAVGSSSGEKSEEGGTSGSSSGSTTGGGYGGLRPRDVHEACAAPLHLNHYAVKSREDYLAKFQRGRISRGEKDLKEGLAVRNTSTGQVVLKKLSEKAVAKFLGQEEEGQQPPSSSSSSSSSSDADAAVDQRLYEIALKEFAVRDFSEVRDEAILKFVPRLKQRLRENRAAAALLSSSSSSSSSGFSGSSNSGAGGEEEGGGDGASTVLRTTINAAAAQALNSRFELDPAFPRAPPSVALSCARQEGRYGFTAAEWNEVPQGPTMRSTSSKSPTKSSTPLPVTGSGCTNGSDSGSPSSSGRLFYGLLPSRWSPLVHLHVPKTGGTNFNLQLAFIADHLRTLSPKGEVEEDARKAAEEGSTHRRQLHPNRFQQQQQQQQQQRQRRLRRSGSSGGEGGRGGYCEVATRHAHKEFPDATLLEPFGNPARSKHEDEGKNGHFDDGSGDGRLDAATTAANSNMFTFLTSMFSSPSSPSSSWFSSLSFLSGSTSPDTPASAAAASTAAASSSSSASAVSSFSTWPSPLERAVGCSVVSGEFDVSILPVLRSAFKRRERVEAVTILSSGGGGGGGGGDLGAAEGCNRNSSSSESSSGDTRKRGGGGDSRKRGEVVLQAMTVLRDPIARAVSQFEHHISRNRYDFSAPGDGGGGDAVQQQQQQQQVRKNEALKAVVSPQLCPQLERRPSKKCRALTNELKCRGNGWCGLFQDHQAESLAGAMSLTLANAQAKRRSSDQLLCEARKALLLGGSGGGCGGGLGVGFVGLVEHSEASLCLLLHTFRVDALFDSCCRPPSPSKERGKCALFSLHTTTNSADDRAQGPGRSDSSSSSSSSSEGSSSSSSSSEVSSSGAGDSGGGSSSYLEAYFSDTSVLAALYEGNRVDCELYASAKTLLKERLEWMETERGLRFGVYSAALLSPKGEGTTTSSTSMQSRLCVRAALAYNELKTKEGGVGVRK